MRLRQALPLVVAAGVLGVFACVGSAAGPVPSPAPGYLSDDYGTVFLASNPLMQGTKVVVKPSPGSANQVTAFPKAKPEPYVFVWGPSCTAAAQTVTFTRDVWLPGPPNQQGQFFYTGYRGSTFYTALKTVDLIVNGKVIVHQNVPSGGYNTVTLPADAMKAFTVGENSYQVRFHKGDTKGTCNTGPTNNVVGVEFALSGHITTDLSVSLNDPTVYRHIGTNTTQAESIVVVAHNNGPSMVVNGTFHVTVCCPTALILPPAESNIAAIIKEKTGLVTVDGCKLTQSGTSYAIDCSIAGLAPGGTANTSALFRVQGPSVDVGDFNVMISWNVSTTGITDPNTQDNQSGAKIVYCTSKPNDPGCPGATSADQSKF
jgi:hypothetical protein